MSASSGGQIGSGVRVAYALSSPHSWLEIPQITDVKVPGITRSRIDSTIHGVTSLKTYIPGLGDVNDAELTLETDLGDTTHQAIEALNISQTTVWVRFQIPVIADLSTTQYYAIQMQARVSSHVIETPIDGLKTTKVMFQFNANYFTQKAMASAF